MAPAGEKAKGDPDRSNAAAAEASGTVDAGPLLPGDPRRLATVYGEQAPLELAIKA